MSKQMEMMIDDWIYSKKPFFDDYEDLESNARIALHFDLDEDFIRDELLNINIEIDYIFDVLEDINIFSYYIKRNAKFAEHKAKREANKKKLKNITELMNDDFIDFLHEHLRLDLELPEGKTPKKDDEMAGYLKHLNKRMICLNEYLNDAPKKSDSKLSNKHFLPQNLFKIRTTAYKTEVSKRDIAKLLYCRLLSQYESITKDNAIDLIKAFLGVTLHKTKVEDTLSNEAVSILKSISKQDNSPKALFTALFSNSKELDTISAIKARLEDTDFNASLKFQSTDRELKEKYNISFNKPQLRRF